MKKNKWVLLIIGLIAVGLIGCGMFSGGDDEIVGSDPGGIPPSQEEPSAEPESQGEPVEAPEQQKQPAAGPKPQEKPASTKPEGQTDEYVIYADQQLVIPVSGGGGAKESIVVDSGIISSTAKQIALTFDAGWLYDQTVDLLNVLDAYQVKSTFFLRGKWVEDHPDLAREILKRGHSVENHSLTHGHMKEMTDEEVWNEMILSTKITEEATGYRPYLFRPPFGEYDNRILKILAQQGYPYTVKWTVDSLDWAEEMNGIKITEQYLIDRVLAGASDKGIILMHVGGYQTVNALPEIIEGLQKDGYKLVKVNDMLPPRPASGDQTIYTVKKGDTLSSIAKEYGVTVEEILRANTAR